MFFREISALESGSTNIKTLFAYIYYLGQQCLSMVAFVAEHISLLSGFRNVLLYNKSERFKGMVPWDKLWGRKHRTIQESSYLTSLIDICFHSQRLQPNLLCRHPKVFVLKHLAMQSGILVLNLWNRKTLFSYVQWLSAI